MTKYNQHELQRAVDDLLALGHLRKNGKRYCITEAGKAALAKPAPKEDVV